MWAVSEKTNVETEHLIYPLSSLVSIKHSSFHYFQIRKRDSIIQFRKSLVADFGGTLSLFLGVSFFTILDNLHIVGKVFRSLFSSKTDRAHSTAPEEHKSAWQWFWKGHFKLLSMYRFTKHVLFCYPGRMLTDCSQAHTRTGTTLASRGPFWKVLCLFPHCLAWPPPPLGHFLGPTSTFAVKSKFPFDLGGLWIKMCPKPSVQEF